MGDKLQDAQVAELPPTFPAFASFLSTTEFCSPKPLGSYSVSLEYPTLSPPPCFYF